MPRIVESRVLTRWLLVAVLVGALPWSVLPAAAAADPLKDNTSLAFVPEDVSFYVAGLRLREVFDKVANSKAVAKLKQIPTIQMGLAIATAQWENPQNPQLAMFKQALQSPENQQLVGLLKDAVSQEVFLYGGPDCGDFIALINELNAASNIAQMEAMASGDAPSAPAAQFKKILEVLNARGDKLKFPTIVKGAKLSDTQAAVAQLKRLETQVTAMLAQQPALASRFAREKIGNAEFLTLRLDGTLVPWPMLLQNAQGVDPQQVQALVTKLSALKLVISIGVRDKYLIVSLGDDNKHLGQLGQGELLYSRSEFEPIRKAGDKPIIEITYASAAFAKVAGGIDAQIDQLTGMVRQMLPMSGLSSALTQEMTSDVEKAATYIKANVPKPAAQLSAYNFLTSDGIEAYSYNWTTESGLDASKKLSVLDHVGGDPIAFWAARGKSDPKQTDALVTLLTRTMYYAEKLVLEKGDPDQKELLAKLREQLQPLADEMIKVTREKLLPAFADGQSALVLDAKSTSESWHVEMPPTETALPILEIGMVNGVSDAGLVKQAFSEYFTIVQKMLDKVHELSIGELKDKFPSEVPAIPLAKPQTKDVPGATVYYYPLPAESGLDAQLAPNAGLSSSFMVSSLLPRFTARLLAETSLKAQGPLADYDRPLASAGSLDFARLIDAITPWIDYVMTLQMGSDDTGVLSQIHDGLEVLKCFRSISGVTYLEGKALVTHVQCHIVDLE